MVKIHFVTTEYTYCEFGEYKLKVELRRHDYKLRVKILW